MGKKLRPQPPSSDNRLKAHPEAVDTNQLTPHFCLRHMSYKYGLNNCNKDHKAALADKIRELSQLTWHQIIQCGRHKLGFEKIGLDQIRDGHDGFPISEDESPIAFRFFGMAPMVGFRRGRVFHVIWLDYDFTLYPH